MESLANLHTLNIINTGVSYLPSSWNKFIGIQALKVKLNCVTIGWLKDFPDLGGTLCLCGLKNIPNLMDVQCANLMNMRNLEHLILEWNKGYYQDTDGSVFQLNIERGQNIFLEEESTVMVCLQPYANLTRLQIEGYNGITFPEWIGSLCKLKYLKISLCDNLQILKAELLPLELEELEICGCKLLVSMSGIQKLKSLVKLSIKFCKNLCSVMEPSPELTNLPSLRSLEISDCFKLQVLADELLPAEPSKVEVSNCPGLREWCLQHRINYKEMRIKEDVQEEENLSKIEEDEEDLSKTEDDEEEPI